LEWIAQHGETISAITGVGTLIVWIIYLQVFVTSYRRQLRATMLITRGPGLGLEARCFLSNMSSGPIYVATIQVELEYAEGSVVCPVTDVVDLDAAGGQQSQTRQGPLRDGETRDIGSFEQLLRHSGEAPAAAPHLALGELRSITVEVVGLYGSEDLPIGARRCFLLLAQDGNMVVRGSELRTRQIRSAAGRRRLLGDLERDQ